MLLLATVAFVIIILIALVIGGVGILITGSVGVLMALLDVVFGGFIIWIPIHIVRKKRRKKENKEEN